MKTNSPIGAFMSGAVSGAVGSLAQTLFFSATARLAPSTPKEAFEPPEAEQREETATQTLARRTIEGLMQRGPIVHKQRDSQIVHYAFGAAFGALYGLLAESSRAMDRPLGALGYGAGVWMAGDNFLLPLFRLGAWPSAYPMRTHVYALAAHLAYGGAIWASMHALRSIA